MLANYHTHTIRCQHAKGEDRAYVEEAIRNGMKVLGFADHCPWVYDDGFVSGTRMTPSQLDEYFTSLEALKKEYARDITLYIGFESEYIPEQMAAQDRLLADYPVDYMILGQHFLEREPHSAYTGFPTDRPEELIRYVDLCIEGMESGRYLYVAHPDLLHFTGDPAIYDAQYLRLCRYLKEKNIPVEINLLGVVEGRHYTSERFLNLAAKAGNSVIIGCDAHTPDRLSYTEGHEVCRRMAEQAGLPIVDFLPGFGPAL
ncbi:MAG: histidinol-phosphatase [Oscillospiraceae bacterium]|nr:histidinol-phosphatase [Oscillospiraceae bacterium]